MTDKAQRYRLTTALLAGCDGLALMPDVSEHSGRAQPGAAAPLWTVHLEMSEEFGNRVETSVRAARGEVATTRELLQQALVAQEHVGERPRSYAHDRDLYVYLRGGLNTATAVGTRLIEVIARVARDHFGDRDHDVVTIARRSYPIVAQLAALDGSGLTAHLRILAARPLPGDLLEPWALDASSFAMSADQSRVVTAPHVDAAQLAQAARTIREHQGERERDTIGCPALPVGLRSVWEALCPLAEVVGDCDKSGGVQA